jgi:quinoprotein relay system zinc metallohydrolase 2
MNSQLDSLVKGGLLYQPHAADREVHMLIRTLLTTISLGVTVVSQTACAQDSSYSVDKVRDGIYYHQGVHEDATEANFGAIANVGFIIGNDCVAVIDSGGSFKEGALLAASMRTITDKPVCYVINTHVHPDHTLGNAAFKSADTIYIGHEKLPAAMAAREGFFERNFSEILGKAYTGTEFIAPSQTVSIDEPVTIDLGNRELVLTAFSTSHTDHDLTVYDKQTQTLWAGDLLFVERTPALDGSINGWITHSEQLQNHPASTVIPGHGPALLENPSLAWQKQLDYLKLIREQIRAIIYDFGTIEDASSSVGLSEKENWLLFEEYHRRNVTAAFVELEWE